MASASNAKGPRLGSAGGSVVEELILPAIICKRGPAASVGEVEMRFTVIWLEQTS